MGVLSHNERRRESPMLFIRTLTAALVALLVGAPAALAVYPNSISATGDSITRAFNTCSPAFRDCPENSWATGTNRAVNSFYERIVAGNAAARGNLFNDARSGARMRHLPEQVRRSIEHRVDYVVIEMGANDVCTSSEATMTSVASFEREFDRAIRDLRERLPGARISVGSIPNVYHLWNLLKENRSATSTWNLLRICQSMLANPTSRSREDEERRLRVQRREVEFNRVLETICAAYEQCRYDRDTGYNYRFRAEEVSTNDYFHPSLTGQATIAEIEWGVTWVF
jgi:lysophospholipase L1-like esterase